MKKFLYILLAVIIAPMFQSCLGEAPEMIEEISVTIRAKILVGAIPPPSFTIQFTNFNDSYKATFTGGSDGLFTGKIMPGLYNVLVSGSAFDEVNNMTLRYSGTITNEYIIEDGKSFNLDLDMGKSSALVMKEIFYAGHRAPSGESTYRCQFYEIYNNSDVVVFVDGLCFGIIYSNVASVNQPNWEMSGNFAGKNQRDYVFFISIWRFPGDGTNYPLQPGESAIFCQWAKNHFEDNAGALDMRSCEFEAWLPNSATMTDMEAHNATIAWYATNPPGLWLTTVNGAAFCMFFPDETIDFDDYVVQQGTSDRGLPIPVDMILDGVECVSNAALVQGKRIPTAIDAGAIYCPGGSYSGQSVARKIQEIKEDGRIIYQDTNNTTEDFEVMDAAMLRRYGAKMPSWNTWGPKYL